jgi:pyruvate dehydrogenase E2 component (dihydrolipoamide acetyltransferase)
MGDVVMPRLSDSMEEGTILKWLKSVGDEVAVGDELVEIETDKANMVYESDSGGTLVEIVAQEGDTLPIGEPIARVGDASEASGNGAGKSEAGAGDEEAEVSVAVVRGEGVGGAAAEG